MNVFISFQIKTFYALGPVATVGQITSPIRILSYYTKEIVGLFDIFGVKDFLPNNEIIKILGRTVCVFFEKAVCENIFFIIGGVDTKNFNSVSILLGAVLSKESF